MPINYDVEYPKLQRECGRLEQRCAEFEKVLKNVSEPMSCDAIWKMVKHPEDWDRAISEYARTELARIKGNE